MKQPNTPRNCRGRRLRSTFRNRHQGPPGDVLNANAVRQYKAADRRFCAEAERVMANDNVVTKTLMKASRDR